MGKGGNGSGGSAHDRAMAKAAAMRANSSSATKKPEESGGSQAVSPTPNPDRKTRFIGFLEHPWVLLVFGVLGGIVGLIYTPVLFVSVGCILGAFHKQKVVSGLKWYAQLAAYLGIGCLSFALIYVSILAIRSGAQSSLAEVRLDIRDAVKDALVKAGGGSTQERVHTGLEKKPSSPPSEHLPITPPDPHYPPSKGPAVRMEGTAVPPSQTMCLGMTGRARENCLCPDPMPYTLAPLPAPNDDNYSTQIDIKKAGRKFYRLRVFAKTMMLAHYGWKLKPDIAVGHGAASLGLFDYDPFSFVLTSTVPQDEFTIEVHTAEGLRLACVNQEN